MLNPIESEFWGGHLGPALQDVIRIDVGLNLGLV